VDRRRFVAGAAGAGVAALATTWPGAARAVTDDDLAFAYFGLSGELLLVDFYSKALGAGILPSQDAWALRHGRSAAKRHAKALSDLLAGAGADVPTAEDFAFILPKPLFTESSRTFSTGLTILETMQGVYQTAAATSSEPTYRVLFASLAASSAQQVGVVRAAVGNRAAEAFPVALDLEAASNAIDRYLG
jgi:ferritin-like protein